MDQIHEVCRRRHLSKRTEEAYRFWIRRFIFFFDKSHPRELREGEVAQFLNHLSVKREVSASTQTQALNALVFLYRDGLCLHSTSCLVLIVFSSAKHPRCDGSH